MKPQMTVTKHEASEWERLSKAAFAVNLGSIGVRFSVASGFAGESMDLDYFDALQSEYRAWLISGFSALDFSNEAAENAADEAFRASGGEIADFSF